MAAFAGKYYQLKKASIKRIAKEIIKVAILKKAWFPGKEELRYFEELADKQVRIWPDSADAGFILTPQKRLEARNHIKKLLDIYNAKIEKGPGKDTTTTMFIPFEQDEGFFVGVEMEIYFHEGGKNQVNPRKPQYDPTFLAIYFKRSRTKDFEYKKEKKASNFNPF